MSVVLITGATSGIGEACAARFAKDARLVLVARNKEKLSSLSTTGSNIRVFALDVRNSDDVDAMFAELDTANITPDVVINAAGAALGLENLEEGNLDDWNEMIDTNVKGLLYVSKLAIERMKKQNKGHIVNLGSLAGIHTYAKGVVYAATKAAVKSISDGLRKEVVAHNIRITNLQPGLVETNFSNIRFHGDTKKASEVYKGIDPLTADDIADVIAYVVNAPEHVHIHEITLTPTHQVTAEIVHRTRDE